MVGTIIFLKHQMLSYWRQSFAVRGKYDANSLFFIVIFLLIAFPYYSFLKNTAQSFSDGDTKNLYLVLLIVFLSWFLPVIENQELFNKTKNFVFFPLNKNKFALINIARLFILPTSLIPLFIFISAVFPFIYLPNNYISLIALCGFNLISAFVIFSLINILKIRIFSISLFLILIIIAILFFAKIDSFSTSNYALTLNNSVNSIVFSEAIYTNLLLLMLTISLTFSIAYTSARYWLYANTYSSSNLSKRLFSKLNIPLRFGELIKKDLLYYWKTFDVWTGLLSAILYAIILCFTEFSFIGFSLAISVILLLNSTLCFNIFGIEGVPGIERLSLFPVSAKDLLIYKNKAFAILILSQIFYIFPLIIIKAGMFFLIISILKTASIILLYIAWGNNLSIKYPFKMGSLGGSIPAMMYGALIISVLILAPELLPNKHLPNRLIVNVLTILFSVLIYRICLRKTSKELFQYWKFIKKRIHF